MELHFISEADIITINSGGDRGGIVQQMGRASGGEAGLMRLVLCVYDVDEREVCEVALKSQNYKSRRFPPAFCPFPVK